MTLLSLTMPNRSLVSWRTLAAVGLLSLSAALPARAALFEDDEARKAILDLRARLTALEDQHRSDLAAAQQQIQQQQRNLLEQNNVIERQRGEQARLLGQIEQLARDLSETQRRLKDTQAQVDERLRKFEPQKVSVDGKEFVATMDERKAYDDVMAVLRSGDFDKAAPALAAFLKRFPDSGYNDAVRYWLGNAQYARRDYREAVGNFRAYLTAAPDSPRAPEAMLALANCQAEMKDVRQARKTLEDLIKQFPKAEAAVAAKERLASLK